MPTVTTAPIAEVAKSPAPKIKEPGKIKEAQSLVTNEMKVALKKGEALVLTCGPNDKVLTLRARCRRALNALRVPESEQVINGSYKNKTVTAYRRVK